MKVCPTWVAASPACERAGEDGDERGEDREPAVHGPDVTRVCGYSHSIVAGGFDETSSATRLTCLISPMIRFETRSSRS